MSLLTRDMSHKQLTSKLSTLWDARGEMGRGEVWGGGGVDVLNLRIGDKYNPRIKLNFEF